MEQKNNEKTFCKKLVYRLNSLDKPTIILGIMEAEDSNFYYFKTAKKLYTIAKTTVLTIEDTSELFREVSL